MDTVTDYNKKFQQDNPQYFGNPTMNTDTMAQNRAKLVAGSGGTLREVNGQVVPVVSSDGGIATINNAIQDQAQDITKLKPKAVDTTSKPVTATKNASLERIGAVTADEANATGLDLSGYVFDDTSKYYVPKTNTNAGQLEKQYEEDKNEISRAFSNRLADFDLASREIVNSIQGIYSARIQAQQDLNKRSIQRFSTLGIRGGTGRYAPEIQNSILTGEEREGLRRIETIASEEASAIAKAQQNLADKKYEAFIDERNMVKQLRQERQAQLEKLQDIAEKERVRLADIVQKEKDTLVKYKNDALLELAKSGVTDVNVINAVKSAQDVSEIVKAAGENLIGGTGIIGEYNFYKKDAIRNGLRPMTFDEYQTRDANRKVSLAGAGGLSSSQNAVVNSAVSSFEANPIVKDFITIQSKYQNVLTNIGKGDGASDIALIYDLMKTLDPTSVVRETEYATGASKSGNIFAGKLASFNGLIKPEGGFVSEVAKDNIVGVIEGRFNVAKSQYENIRNEKIRNLKNRGVDGGDAYLPQYDYEFGAGKDIIKQQLNEEKQLLDYVTANPTLSDKAITLAETVDPTTGLPFTPAQVLEFLKQSK